jgi:hypothetical protein
MTIMAEHNTTKTQSETRAMSGDTHATDITHVIQLAIAPVFLLTAVGTIIGVMSTRLGRAVDRIRLLEERLRGMNEADAKEAHRELSLLARRMRLIYISIGLAVICAIMVSMLIAITFIDAFLAVDLSRVVGVLFVVAMFAFIGSLIIFLREIFVAINNTRYKLGKDWATTPDAVERPTDQP